MNIRKVNTPLTTDNVPNPTIKLKTIDKLAKTVISDVSIMITSGVWTLVNFSKPHARIFFKKDENDNPLKKHVK